MSYSYLLQLITFLYLIRILNKCHNKIPLFDVKILSEKEYFKPYDNSKTIRIFILSDTHKAIKSMNIEKYPPVDIVLHGGDFTVQGVKEDVISFIEEFKKIKAKYKILIAGNHELTFDEKHKEYNKTIKEMILNEKDFIYLENESINIMGLNIYGCPNSLKFSHTAFMTPKNAKEFYKNNIKEGVDIILHHGPPYKILDKNIHGKNEGCKYLRERIFEVKPSLVIFGHIHEGYGIHKENGITFINAAATYFKTIYKNKPLIVDLIKKER